MLRHQSVYGTVLKDGRGEEELLSKRCSDDDHYSCFLIDVVPPREGKVERIACCQYTPAYVLHVS